MIGEKGEKQPIQPVHFWHLNLLHRCVKIHSGNKKQEYVPIQSCQEERILWPVLRRVFISSVLCYIFQAFIEPTFALKNVLS